MGVTPWWKTPFWRQCFVTAGVSLNMMQHGLTFAFTSLLLPQLKTTKVITDEVTESWIASIIGFAMIIGVLIVPVFMHFCGRRTINLISAITLTSGWLLISSASTVPSLLTTRFILGLAIGLMSFLGALLIGEYTSPKNRGAFLTTISLAILSGILIVHSLGSFFCWQRAAYVLSFISFIVVIIIFYSPESPSFLASRGKYDECKKSFHWLRGYDEDDELEKMIKTEIKKKQDKCGKPSLTQGLGKKLLFIKDTVKKQEFYKPVILMIHMFTMCEWSGSATLDAFTTDIVHMVLGTDKVSLVIISLDIQRIISNSCAIFMVRNMKRRSVFVFSVAINISAHLIIAAYTYAKVLKVLPFDHPLIGFFLMHVHMFSVASGMMTLPNVIAGEIFPLEFKAVAAMISSLFFSINLSINIKTAPYLFSTIGVHGAYLVNAGILSYCVLVIWFLLPETKDRTLQDIEEEFRSTKTKIKSTSLISNDIRASETYDLL